MKKICLTVVAASAMLFSAQNLSAQVAVEEQVAVEATVSQDSEYTQIEITDLPAEVQQALERDYEGAVITEAYVKEVEGAKEFKLVVKTAKGEEKELHADAEGNWIDQDQE
ncbi:hypothetical protein [Salinimicrobium soli]|uniref:hypothetical protein n=1 Tax=Salinimicrobium soli TaxID=1254399 RepID=UPI003AADD185